MMTVRRKEERLSELPCDVLCAELCKVTYAIIRTVLTAATVDKVHALGLVFVFLMLLSLDCFEFGC